MKIKIILIFLLSAMVFSGCSTAMQQTVSISQRQSFELMEKCRLDRYYCDNGNYFSPAMDIVKKLLHEFRYANLSPENASIGIGCNISLTNKLSASNNNQPSWFVEIQLEFYDLDSMATLRKKILNGQTAKQDDLLALIEDMLRAYLGSFVTKPPLEVPLANGQTEFDKEGRKLLKAGDYKLAIEKFMDATDADPQNHACWYNLGLAFELVGQYNNAITCYSKAYEIKPEDLYQQGIMRIGFNGL